jgi:hypothetical protein
VDGQAVLFLSLLLLGAGLVLLRVTPRVRRRLLLLALLLAGLVYRWIAYRGAWRELAVAAVIALAALLVWWRIHGRRLPPPSEGQIRVWTPEDPF